MSEGPSYFASAFFQQLGHEGTLDRAGQKELPFQPQTTHLPAAFQGQERNISPPYDTNEGFGLSS